MLKANARMTATLAVVISLFAWAAAASPAQAQKKKASGANKAAQQADREAKKEERAAAKEARQAGKGAGKADREARKEERAAKKEERQAKKKEKQDARGDSARSADAANDGTTKKSRRANAAGQSGTDNLNGEDDPFGAKGKPKAKGKRAAKSQQAGADATGEGEAAPEATQNATTTGEQPEAKGRRAKAKAAATASNASTEATTTTSTPSTSTGATSSSVSGDTPPAVETPVEQPEATEPAAAGGGSKDGTNQKFMKTARQDLNKALNALKRASADKGGHRERAVDLVQQAVAEVDKGMTYDKQNPNDRQRERPGKRSEQQPRGEDVDGASGVRFVAASWAAQKPSEQPNMQMAKTHLQSALSNLDKATADKGGFRVNAVRLAREALKEVEQGIAYDNTHKDGN